MKNALTNQYQHLTPIERFRLVIAADGRGDRAEIDRLTNSGGTELRRVSDHRRFSRAFIDLAHFAFMDLVEEALGFQIVLDHSCTEDKKPKPDSDDCIPKHWDNVMFKGYWLRTKYFGWERFCKSLGVPAFSLWAKYPGYERMASTVTMAGTMSYVAVGFVRSLNRKRSKGAPKMTKCPLTVNRIAKEWRGMYRQSIKHGS